LAFTFTTLFSGCKQAGDIGKTGTDTVKGSLIQLNDYLKDKTVLPRLKAELDKNIVARKKTQESADKYSEAADRYDRAVKREEEKLTTKTEERNALLEIAKKAGLPKPSEAKPEDNTKQIPYGGQSRSGSDVYRFLKDYQREIESINDNIAREKGNADTSRRDAEDALNYVSLIDDKLHQINKVIKDYESAQKKLEELKDIQKLGLDLGDSEVERLLSGNTLVTEATGAIDGMKAAADGIGNKLKNAGSGKINAIDVSVDNLW
jgi:hypothetical protein